MGSSQNLHGFSHLRPNMMIFSSINLDDKNEEVKMSQNSQKEFAYCFHFEDVTEQTGFCNHLESLYLSSLTNVQCLKALIQLEGRILQISKIKGLPTVPINMM